MPDMTNPVDPVGAAAERRLPPVQWGHDLTEEPEGRVIDRRRFDLPDRDRRCSADLRKRVIAIDPGDRRVGIATATVEPGNLTKTKGFVMGPKEFALWLAEQQGIGQVIEGHGHDNPHAANFDIIVYETWRPRPIDGTMSWIQGNPLLATQLIGMIRMIGWLSGAVLRGQGPDVKKAAFAQIESGMADTAILKRRIHSSTEQHDKDALAHLWRYYRDHWRV